MGYYLERVFQMRGRFESQEIVSGIQVFTLDGGCNHIFALHLLDLVSFLGEDALTGIIEKIDSDLALDVCGDNQVKSHCPCA